MAESRTTAKGHSPSKDGMTTHQWSAATTSVTVLTGPVSQCPSSESPQNNSTDLTEKVKPQDSVASAQASPPPTSTLCEGLTVNTTIKTISSDLGKPVSAATCGESKQSQGGSVSTQVTRKDNGNADTTENIHQPAKDAKGDTDKMIGTQREEQAFSTLGSEGKCQKEGPTPEKSCAGKYSQGDNECLDNPKCFQSQKPDEPDKAVGKADSDEESSAIIKDAAEKHQGEIGGAVSTKHMFGTGTASRKMTSLTEGLQQEDENENSNAGGCDMSDKKRQESQKNGEGQHKDGFLEDINTEKRSRGWCEDNTSLRTTYVSEKYDLKENQSQKGIDKDNSQINVHSVEKNIDSSATVSSADNRAASLRPDERKETNVEMDSHGSARTERMNMGESQTMTVIHSISSEFKETFTETSSASSKQPLASFGSSGQHCLTNAKDASRQMLPSDTDTYSGDELIAGAAAGDGSSSFPDQASQNKNQYPVRHTDGGSGLPAKHSRHPLHPVGDVRQLLVELLKMDNVSARFFEKLVNCGFEIVTSELYEGYAVLNRGDLDLFFKVLNSFISVQSFEIQQCDEISDILKELQNKEPLVRVKQYHGTLYAVFHCSMKLEIDMIWHKLKTISKTFQLPGYFATYIYRHWEYVQQLLRLPASADMKLEGYTLVLTADRVDMDLASVAVISLLCKLMFHQSPCTLSTCLFLDSVQGQQCRLSVEEKCKCSVSVELPDQPGVSTLLKTRSAHGHQVVVCNGAVADTDCQTIVLPLLEGQTDWTHDQQEILTRGFLPLEIERYHQRFGKKCRVQTFECQESGFQHQVIMMHLPVDMKDTNGHRVREMLSSIMKDQSQSGAALAIPVIFNKRSAVKLKENLKVILQSIIDSLNSSIPAMVVKLYVDMGAHFVDDICAYVARNLEHRKWTSTAFNGEYMNGHSVRVVVGDILDFKADIVVNSAHADLKLMHGKVSSVLLDKAGKQLSQQCKERYPQGLDDHVLAITDTFNLKKFEKMFHITLPLWISKKSPLTHEKWLRTRVESCLAMASVLGYRSILFPTLGTGTLGYPPAMVAQIMFTTFREFFSKMPHSSVTDVSIVCYSTDTSEFVAFKLEEARYAFRLNAIMTYEVVLEMHKTILHVIQRSPQLPKSPTPGDFVIHALQPQTENKKNYKRIPAAKRVMLVVNGKASEEALKDVFSKIAWIALQSKCLHSLRIDLYTFETDDAKDIVAAMQRHMSDGKYSKRPLKLVTLVVDSCNDLHMVCGGLKGSNFKTRSSSFGGGETVQVGAVAMPSTLPLIWTGKVTVCGSIQNSLNAVKDVFTMDVPGKFVEKAEQFPERLLTQTSTHLSKSGPTNLETRTDGAVEAAEEAKQTDQKCAACMIIVPQSIVCGTDGVGFKKFQQLGLNVDIHGQNLEFKVDFKSLSQHAAKIQEAIKQIKSESEHVFSSNRRDFKAGRPSWTKEVGVLEHEALKFLLGEKFTDHFLTHGETKDTVIITLKGDPCDDVISKIDSLRREDVAAGVASNMSFDIMSEGVEAYAKALPTEGKVAIFAFDYNSCSKAKHLIGVKTGNIKTSSRARRRFDEGVKEEQAKDSSLQIQQLAPKQQRADFTTRCAKIKVSVYRADITKLPVDAIVNAANERLSHGGGVAYAIAKAAGPALELDCDDHITKHGPLKVSQVVATPAYNLPCKAVLHAVGPCWVDYSDKFVCTQDLESTVFNCLHTAAKKDFQSVAVSSISSAIFGVPQKICAESYLTAVTTFDRGAGHNTSLQQIHFVDVNENMVSIICNVFNSLWDTDIPRPLQYPGLTGNGDGHVGDTVGTGSWPLRQHVSSAEEQSEIGHGKQPESMDTPSGEQQTGSNFSRPDKKMESSWDSLNQESLPCSQHSLSYHKNQAPSNQEMQSGKQQDGCDSLNRGAQSQQADCQCIESARRMETYRGRGKDGSDKFKFSFPGISVYFKIGSNFDLGIDSYVYWQKKDELFKDHLLLQQGTGLQIFLHRGQPVVVPFSHVTQEEMQVALLQTLIKLDEGGARSVIIPRYPFFTKASNDQLTKFSHSVYNAVVQFSKFTGRKFCLTDIIIFDSDRNNTLAMVDIFSLALSKEASEETKLHKRLHFSHKTHDAPSKAMCSICQDDIKQPKMLDKCGHTFCLMCIEEAFKSKPVCPVCQKVYGIVRGDQPKGNMNYNLLSTLMLAGFPEGGFRIDYQFPDGTQNEEHPNPGKRYSGTHRTAYLPDTEAGRKVLVLLTIAFERCLIFTVGHSSTTGKEGQVIWNDIHHKTNERGGPSNHGYPDPDYLERVTKELARKGVTENDFTDKQRRFINKIEML